MLWTGPLDDLSESSWVPETGAQACSPPARGAGVGGSTWRG